MNKSLAAGLVGIFAFTCFLISVTFMPWSELVSMPPWLAPLVQPLDPIKKAVADLIPGAKDPVLNQRYQASSPDTPFDTYVYAAFLSAALVAAAIAINVIGREDAEEKTILPVKK